MNLDNVSREEWIVGGLALLIALAILVFPWYHVSVSVGAFSASADRAAASSPYAIWGILALLTSLALVADYAIEKLSPQTQLPAIGGSRAMTRLAIVGATGVLLVIKFLAHIGDFGWGFFLILVAFGVLAYFSYMQTMATPAGAPGPVASPPPPPSPPPAAEPPPPPPPAEPTGAGGPGESTPPPGS